MYHREEELHLVPTRVTIALPTFLSHHVRYVQVKCRILGAGLWPRLRFTLLRLGTAKISATANATYYVCAMALQSWATFSSCLGAVMDHDLGRITFNSCYSRAICRGYKNWRMALWPENRRGCARLVMVIKGCCLQLVYVVALQIPTITGLWHGNRVSNPAACL